MFYGNNNFFTGKKNTKRKNLNFFLILLGIVIYLGTVFYCFYSLNKIEKTVNFSYPYIEISKNTNSQKSIENFKIKIEKIGIVAPVIANVDGANKNIYNDGLKNGVAHLKGTALPGQGSNIFIFGHSSSIVGTGEYSKIFAKLNNIEKEDEITIFYKNKEFHYKVFEKRIILKNDVSVINPTEEEQLTLMTCWPIGTADKRLIIKSSLVK